MTDKTDSKERDAFEHAERASDLRRDEDCPDEYRNQFVQAAWDGWKARASLAANAGSEPVAWVDERALSWLANSRSLSATITTKLERGKSFERPMPLYTHPSPPEGMVGGCIAEKEPPCKD